jgi:hypothetical protein
VDVTEVYGLDQKRSPEEREVIQEVKHMAIGELPR